MQPTDIMDGKILIVEDEFIIASSLKLILEEAGYEVQGIATSVAKALDMIHTKRPAWVFLDIYLSGRLTGIDLARQLVEMDIPFIYVSANSNHNILMEARTTKPYGFLVKPFREQDVLVTLEVAKYRHEHDIGHQLRSEMVLKDEVVKIFAETVDKAEELSRIITALGAHIPHDCFSVSWKGSNERIPEGRFFIKGKDGTLQSKDVKDIITDIPKPAPAYLKKAPVLYPRSTCFSDELFTDLCRTNPLHNAIARHFQQQAALVKTLEIPDRGLLTFTLYGATSNAFRQQHATLFDRLEVLLIKIASYFPHLKRTEEPGETIVADTAAGPPVNLEDMGMIGGAANFQQVKDQLHTVAPFDVSVLILGESGTGKEKVAHAIHHLSERSKRPFIKVNCAAIPATLIESELFGHEKGSFTGALDRRIGKFEQANGGTVFLDEIGEIPLDLQVKLLCVLQEREIVRIGSNEVIKTDIRIIAATNRNLEKSIAEGSFRLDLYYRLNVFPITMPPLRDRKEDIPALVTHFITTLSAKMRKPPKQITDDALQALLNYEWPGNIRELENIIERSLVLNKGNSIEYIYLPSIDKADIINSHSELKVKTIREMEKEHILATLELCKGRVSGLDGAAKLLDISPTTLIARLKKLGISKDILP